MQFFNKHCIWGTLLTLLPTLGQAQVSAYSFSQSAGTYTPITTGTSFAMGDDIVYTATIPSFSFNGANYTSLTISTNGFIKFGTVGHSSGTYSPISSTLTGTGGIVAPFGRDLNTATTGTPEIRIDTAVGSEIVIQWQDVRRYGVTSERISFQTRLNKTNGQINVVYGGTITPGSNTTYPEVGLRGATNADYNNRSVLSTTGAWLNSVAGASNAASCYFNSATTATTPAIGTTFSWTPPSCFAPSGLAAAIQNGSTVNFSWATSITSGQLVVVPQGSAASIGTPSAVSGTSATIGSLTGGTAYSAYIRLICAVGDTSGWSAPVNFTPICTNTTGLAVTTTTLTSATFSWTTSQTGQIVVVPQGSAASVGTPSAISGTTATVSGLTQSTPYSVYIRRICGVGDTSAWSSVVNFATQCGVANLPWSESFENINVTSGNFSLGVQPVCWARIGDIYGGNGSLMYNRMARTGTKYASVGYGTTTGTGDWMFTPAFNLTAGTSYDFSFWYITDGLAGWDTLRVGFGTSQTAAAMTIIGTRVNAATNTSYAQYRVTFTPTTTGTYHMGVNVWAISAPWYITFDDFNLEATPVCAQPSNVTAVSLGIDSARIAWSAPGTGSSWYVYYGATGSTPGSNLGTLLTDTAITLNGLTPNTSYSFFVREYCSAGDTSSWNGPFTFTTNCPASTPGDSMATAINVTGTSYTTTNSTVRCFTNTIGNTAPDVWYRVILDPCATQITASLCTGTSFDSYLRIYNSTGSTQLGFNDDGCGSQSIITNLNVSAHDTVYVVVEGYSSNTGTYTLSINQTTVTPVANIGYAAASYCQNATTNPIPTNSGTTGGVYSIVPATMTIDAINGQLALASGQPTTTYNVMYTVGQPGCQAIDTVAVTINTPDNASFSYANSAFCTTAGIATATVTGLAGGMFSSIGSGLALDTLTGAINTSASMGGNYSVIYRTNGTCPSTNTVAVRIDTIQDASFMYSTPTVCANAATQVVTLTGLAGGMFSASNGLALDTLTGSINVMNSQLGTYVVTYTMPNTCASSSTDTFTILAMDNASFSYASSIFCQNANNPSPTVTGLAGGAFSSNTGLPVDISTGIIDLFATTTGTTHTVIYATNGACPNFSIANITVLPADTAEFSYPATTYCLTNNISVVTPSITGSTGGRFSTTPGLRLDTITGGFHIDMMASVNGTYTIRYVTNGPTTCPDTATAVVTLNTCVGVEEVVAQQGFAAFPNPTAGVFMLQNNGDDAEARLQIIDALGRIVYTQENLFLSKGGNVQINAQNLAAGTYYVRIWSNANFTTIPLQVITR